MLLFDIDFVIIFIHSRMAYDLEKLDAFSMQILSSLGWSDCLNVLHSVNKIRRLSSNRQLLPHRTGVKFIFVKHFKFQQQIIFNYRWPNAVQHRIRYAHFWYFVYIRDFISHLCMNRVSYCILTALFIANHIYKI